MIEQMSRDYFPDGLPDLPDQWLDFAEHVASVHHKLGQLEGAKMMQEKNIDLFSPIEGISNVALTLDQIKTLLRALNPEDVVK